MMPRTPSNQRASTVLDDLPFCLARASLSFRRLNDQSLRAVGVDLQAPGLASVMHAAEELGDCTVNQLVEKTHLPNGTLTGLLDSLEREGHLRRISNPQDGRSWLIQVTAKGGALCAKLHRRHRVVMEIFRKALTKSETRELTRLLEKLTVVMRDTPLEPESPKARTRVTKTSPRRG